MAKLNEDYDYVKQWALDHLEPEVHDIFIDERSIFLPGIPFGEEDEEDEDDEDDEMVFDVEAHFEKGCSTRVDFSVKSIYERYGAGYSDQKDFLNAFVEKYPSYQVVQNSKTVWLEINSADFCPNTKTQVGGQIAIFIRDMKRFLGSKASGVKDYPDGYDYLVGHEIKKAPARAPKKAKEPSGKGGSDEGSVVVGLLLGLFTSLIGFIICLIMRKKKTWIGWVIGVVAEIAVGVIIALINSAA